jgi:hypothetical protein
MTCCFEPLKPIKGKKIERRDGLNKTTIGNTGKPRKRPHMGCDWGYIGGSLGEDYYAIHSGTVTAINKTGELGFLIIVKRDGCTSPDCVGIYDEYCHSGARAPFKLGDKVIGGRTVLNQMGDEGSPGAPHLHACSAKHPIPHESPREKLNDLFADIDKSVKERAALKAATPAKA